MNHRSLVLLGVGLSRTVTSPAAEPLAFNTAWLRIRGAIVDSQEFPGFSASQYSLHL
jgi:hypothetical protein